ncbi:MAG: hypothetical protein ABSG95_12525 [Solirubrobacteraceae bacterium]|jgi:uncharacterized membrane protein
MELRALLTVCVVVIGVAFGLCMRQNHALLHFMNRPYTQQT